MTDSSAERELPDDMNCWPSDPRTLFGLTSDPSRRDLKRAYTRLIRRFKPEHAPDQFRRLRELFEQFDHELEWRETLKGHRDRETNPISESGHETNQSTSNPTQRWADSKSGPADETGTPAATDAAEIDAIIAPDSCRNADRLWQQALDGDDHKIVYLQLADLAARHPHSEIGFARLYWLLTIHPDFDPNRDPCQWLIEGLRSLGLKNRLLPMLSTDVHRRLGNVPAMIAFDLLERPQPAGALVELAQVRWFAARKLSRFDVIESDVEQLRRRFLDEPEQWQRLLLIVARQLVLVQSTMASTLLVRISDEIAHTPANIESNWLWDSFEAVVALHDIWRGHSRNLEIASVQSIRIIDIDGRPAAMTFTRTVQARMTLERLVKLIQKTWAASTHQVRAELVPFCAELMENPVASLNELAAISQIARPLIHRLLELIQEQLLAFVDPDAFKITPAVQQLLREFVVGDLWQSQTWHITVLTFCLKEAVTPSDIANAIEQHHEGLPESSLVIAESLRFHLPLMCVVEAKRLLWS